MSVQLSSAGGVLCWRSHSASRTKWTVDDLYSQSHAIVMWSRHLLTMASKQMLQVSGSYLDWRARRMQREQCCVAAVKQAVWAITADLFSPLLTSGTTWKNTLCGNSLRHIEMFPSFLEPELGCHAESVAAFLHFTQPCKRHWGK